MRTTLTVTELSTRMKEEKEPVRGEWKTLERVHDVYEIDMYGWNRVQNRDHRGLVVWCGVFKHVQMMCIGRVRSKWSDEEEPSVQMQPSLSRRDLGSSENLSRYAVEVRQTSKCCQTFNPQPFATIEHSSESSSHTLLHHVHDMSAFCASRTGRTRPSFLQILNGRIFDFLTRESFKKWFARGEQTAECGGMMYEHIQRGRFTFHSTIALIFSLRFDVQFWFSLRLSFLNFPFSMFIRFSCPTQIETSLQNTLLCFSLAEFIYLWLSRERSASKVTESGVTLSVFVRVCCVHILFVHVRAVPLHGSLCVFNRRLFTCLIQVSLVFTERATWTPQNPSNTTSQPLVNGANRLLNW